MNSNKSVENFFNTDWDRFISNAWKWTFVQLKKQRLMPRVVSLRYKRRYQL